MSESESVNKTEAAFESLLSTVLSVAFGPPMMLLRAWAIQVLWGWYLAATLGPLSFGQAIGASLLVAFVRSGPTSDDTSLKAVFGLVGTTIVRTAILLGYGWILRGVLS